MMRFFLLLIGLTLPIASAEALAVPPMPPTQSPYIQEVFDAITDSLTAATGGTPAACTPFEKDLARKEAAANIRLLFADPLGGSKEPARDLDRTACYAHDLQTMEGVLASLIAETIKSAGMCNGSASESYRTATVFLWQKIRDVRQYGLSPTAQAPVIGTGATHPPLLATSASDDGLCPYNSRYAPTGFAGLGCNSAFFPVTAPLAVPSVLREEIALLERISTRISNLFGGGLADELSLYRSAFSKISGDAAAFVNGISLSSTNGRPPRVLTLLFEPVLTSFVASNVGESGCYGWPSSAGGVVSGKDLALRNEFPGVLTRELAEAFEFLRMREDPKWQEYLQSLQLEIARTDGGGIGYTFPAENLGDINREHVAMESHLILSIRDPQIRMANLANDLHDRTRAFTAQAVNLTGSPVGTPPLREFVQRFTTFLSGMCSNRGCGKTLLRAFELSFRDECFSQFRSALFFSISPTAGTLPACRAKFADQ